MLDEVLGCLIASALESERVCILVILFEDLLHILDEEEVVCFLSVGSGMDPIRYCATNDE